LAAKPGWYLPDNEEWWILADFLDNSGYTTGGKIKETGTGHWVSPNTGATNESGFSALPGGERSYSGGFNYLGDYAEFWTSSEFDATFIQIRILFANMSVLYPDAYDRRDGFSVRCLKN